MPVSVVIPFAGECPARLAARDYVCGRYQVEHPDWEVVVGEGDPQAWSKARAVDAGLEHATGELLVIADADVWCDDLDLSVHDINNGADWAIPHRHVHRLDAPSTTRFFGGDRAGLRKERAPYWGKRGGGIVVIRRDTYNEVPLDPRFIGWGEEDTSFGIALSTLIGKPIRRRAPLFHFFHPPQPERPELGTAANKALGARYVRAQNRVPLMRSIVEGAWLRT